MNGEFEPEAASVPLTSPVCSFGHCRNSSRVMMWQVACIEAFDLLDARSGILGEIEDVLSPQNRILLQLRFFQ